MNWQTIDTTEELEALDNEVCWADGEILEAYRIYSAQSYFPQHINRSGYNRPNLHLLIDVGFGTNKLLEVVLIHTTATTINSFNGFVSNLKIVHLGDESASRLIYRWVEEDSNSKPGYFVEKWET